MELAQDRAKKGRPNLGQKSIWNGVATRVSSSHVPDFAGPITSLFRPELQISAYVKQKVVKCYKQTIKWFLTQVLDVQR